MSALRIYVTNLGKYNEGELVGEWVDLPVSDEELQDVYRRIGISDEPDEYGQVYEEVFITDYETDIDGIYVREYDNIQELNKLAEKIESLSDWELKIFSNAVEAGFFDPDDIEDFDPSRFILYEGVSTPQELGIAQIEYDYGDSEFIPAEVMASNFDYEAYGRDENIQFYAPDWLDIDPDDTEEVARVCAEYGVEDLADITAYEYWGVSDDDELGHTIIDEYYGSPLGLGKDKLELYFDYASYGSNTINAGVGSFTTDGFIEDTNR